MAARENQPYLIAVIVLVLVALALALAAFLGLSKAGEYADVRDQLQTDLAFQKKLAEARAIEANILKAYIGDLGPSVAEVETLIGSLGRQAQGLAGDQQTAVNEIVGSIKNVQEVYTKDMLANVASGEGEDPQEFTWRGLITNLSSVLGKKHIDLNIKNNQAKDAQRDAATKITSMQNTMDELDKTLKTTQDKLASELQRWSALQQELTTALEEGRSENEKLQGAYDNFRQVSQAKENDLNNQVAEIGNENVLLKNKVNRYEREVFDRPDGQVVKVASDLGMVFVDLGRVDGLSANRTFAIYDQSVTNFEKGSHKAMIEVTRIGDRQAEARVTDENPIDPILTGDYVLTATWDPGFKVQVALAGGFDLDHDGFDDSEKLVQMIERNGGEVVANHDADGNIQGKIDADTRYLVLGDPPDMGPDANPAVVTAMKTLEEQADRNTVQVIGLNKLLNRMGVRAQPRVERLNQRLRDGFPTRTPSDVQ